MKNQLLSVLGVTIMALFISVAVSAQPQEQRKEKAHQGIEREHGPADQLKLTDAQKAQFKDLHMQMFKEVKPLKDELRELEAHHQTLVTQNSPDIEAIYKSIDKMSVVKTKLAKIQANYHQKMRALLTDEQRVMFDQRRDNGMRRNFAIKMAK
ncbi:MAG: Spy/CpxP family protein refolding chaperone [Bacteroidota bacterium]|nr:Spy/CpxP family protein refolding chaperone [Bacteroidota bacterium]MDP4205687.1 Spy/CpxP family protein refolding chaperone [Bacteroidota bacterium]